MPQQWKLLTIAYAVLVLLMVLGFLRVEGIQNNLERESMSRTNLLCELSNQDQQNLLRVLEQVYAPPLSANIDAETREAREEFLRDMRESLSPVDCPPGPDDLNGAVGE